MISLARPSLLASLTASAALVSLLLAGCGGNPQKADELVKVRFQTDWYPQAEHGGYYQALVDGSFAAAGIDVDILPGGPSALAVQKVITGRCEFGMSRSDDVMLAVQEGLPIVIVCALMQHDPQALLLHEENPILSFNELNGKTVMAVPASAWIRNVEATYGISINIIPLNFGLAQFMADPGFIQQCFVTNEPFFVAQNGIRPKTLLIANSGYDPYRVIFTSRKFAAEHPDRVRAFVAASIKGWDTYLNGDASAANTVIASRNENMSEGLLNFSINAMKDYHLVDGDAAKNERIGLLQRHRLSQLGNELFKLGLLSKPMPIEDYATFDFLPDDLKPLVDR